MLTLDRSNSQLPLVDSDFGSFLTDASLFELDELEHFKETNEDTSTSIGIDLTRETGFGSIKFGANIRWREKKTDEEAEIYSGDGTWFLDQAVLPNGGAAYGFSTPIDPVPDNGIERDSLADGTGLEFEDLDSQIDSNGADFVFGSLVYCEAPHLPKRTAVLIFQIVRMERGLVA